MAVNIKLKRSGVAGKIPTTSSLELGELALNTFDGRAFFKQQVGSTESVIELATTAGSGSSVASASYATSASYAFYAINAGNASTANFATSASHAANSISASFAIQAQTASYVPVSISSSYAVSSSFAYQAQTASSADSFVIRNSATASNLLVTDTITAQRLVVQFVTSSQELITGSLIVSGTLNAVGGVTGSLLGTASFATSASYAATASYLNSLTQNVSITGSLNVSAGITGSFSGSLANLQGSPTYIPFFSSSQVLANSAMYQIGTSSIAINETNITTANPEALYVFQTHPTSINVVTGKGNLNNYLQLNIQNTNQGISASSDIVATANNGNEFTNYIDMGINSENFGTNFIGGANDAYLYSIANNLHIGSAATGSQHLGFFVGGDDVEANNKLQLNPNNQHQMSGSLNISGSLTVRNGITGSLFGTASWAISSSFNQSSSFANSASYAATAISSSYAQSSSFANSASYAAIAINAQSASYAGAYTLTSSFNSFTSSYLTDSASFDTRITTNSASVATLSSSFLSASSSFNTRILTNSASIASLSSSFLAFSSSYNTGSFTGSFTGSILGNLTGTSSFATSASYAQSASFANSASYAATAISASYSINATSASYVNPLSQSVQITGSLGVTGSVSITGSGTVLSANVDTIIFTGSFEQSGSVVVNGNITSTGTITAQQLNVQVITSSVDFVTGSTRFGTLLSNTHLFTGSVSITGSLGVAGPLNVSNGITGSLLGTASFAVSSSYAQSGSYANSASYAATAISASNAISASYANSSSFSVYAQSASHAEYAESSSFAQNAISSSYAVNADLLDGRDSSVFATTGSNIFVGNQTVTGSLFTTGSNTLVGSTTLTGSLNVSGSTTQVGNNTLLGNTTLSGSIIISGSLGSTPTVQIYGDTTHNGYIRFDPVTTNINQSLSASYIYVSGSTNDLYFTQNGNGYNNTTRLRWLEGNLYTGLLHGGLITITTGSTTFNLSSGSGIVVNLNASLGDDPYPTITYVNWGNFTNVPLTYLTSSIQSYIGIDSSGNITQQNSPFTDGEYNTKILIGSVLHQNQTTVNASITYPNVAYGYKQRTYDFIKAFGPLKLSGLNIIPSSSLGLTVGSGTAWADGRNYQTDPNNPSYITDPGTSVSKIFRYYQSGSSFVQDTNGGAGYTVIDPANYNPNGSGSLTAVPGTGGNRQWSIQRIFWYPNSATKGIVVYYGNVAYANEIDAAANINYEQFLEVENTKQNAVYLGALILRNDAVFTDSTTYRLLPGGIFRNVGGSGGGGNISTLLLSQLGDVTISGPTGGQPLAYDANALKWKNLSYISASISGNAATATSASYATTASLAATASSADNFTVRGTLTAQQLVVQFITSSQELITGSLIVSGSLTALGGVTGSLLGTASFASSASNANTANSATSASFAQTAISASYASNVPATASFAVSASQALSSSYALTASFALNGGGGGISAIYIADEGTLQGTASYFDFTGTGVVATVSAGTASINISGGGGSAVQGASQTFTQSIAATTWSFSHGINSRTPVVEVYDSNYNVILPSNIYNPGPYQTNVYFDVAQSGYAIISTGGVLAVSGANAVLNQNSASTTWSFSHDLHTQYPVFTIYDSNNDVIIPQRINVVDTASAVIYFSTPRTGKAVASVGGNISFASESISSSYATTASYANVATSASFAGFATSASYSLVATSASYALNATSASWITGSNVFGVVSNATSASYALSSSFGTYAQTASSADNFTVRGTLTAQLLVVQTITASQELVTGSLIVSGALSALGGVTGSLLGTASFANSASNANIANSASLSQVAISSSYSLVATSASYALNATSASWITGSNVVGVVSNATSASYALTASYAANVPATSSFAISASQANSASYALTASYALNAGAGAGFPYSGSAVITGSLLVSGSGITGSLNGTASYAISASFATYASNTPGTTIQFSQSVAATTWSFVHNLNTRNPIVQVYDTDYKQIIPNDIVGLNVNTAEVRFDYAQAGYVIMSNGGGLYVTGSTSELVQSVGATTWSFTHNLNSKYVNFTVYDSNDFVIVPANIKVIDANSAELYFAYPQTGRAVAQFSGINGAPNATTASYALTASYASVFTLDRALLDYAQVNSSVVGSNNLYTQATGSYTAAFFKYTVASGSNARAGEISAVWNGTTVEFTDVSTADIGSTTAVTGSVSIVGTDVQFNVQTNTSGWRIKSTATFM